MVMRADFIFLKITLAVTIRRRPNMVKLMNSNGLHHRVAALMRERNWATMTKVQELALEPILKGRNTLIIAPTGFGKTEAAILPILSKMMDEGCKPVSLLYITPLKALINDITIRIDWWASKLGLLVNRKHGEVPQKEKNQRLKRVPHILVTTPEGLEIDLDWASRFRENYKNVKWVIVDEIHEIVGSKRGAQLFILLERLKEFSGTDFQRIGLSATVGNPKFVASTLFGSSTRQRSIVKIDEKKDFSLVVRKVDEGNNVWSDSAKAIEESIEPPTLIFTDSRFLTERLHEELERLGKSNIYVHHSSISRDSKATAEESLRAGKAQAVLCTKTLELGIDVGKIKKIVLYRPPPSVASFLQRLGRSGHCVGGIPKGEIICVQNFDCLEALAIYNLSRKGVVESPRNGSPLDVVSREILGMVLQYSSIDAERVYRVITSSFLYRKLKRSDFQRLLDYLAKNNLIQREGDELRLGKSFFRIWTFKKDRNFSWSRSFSEFFSLINNDDTFVLRYNDRPIGEIDAIYVYKHIRPGDLLRIGGKLWRVSKIHNGKLSIELVPAERGEGEIPVWKGEGVPKSHLLPMEIQSILSDFNNSLKSQVLDQKSREELSKLMEPYLTRGAPLPNSSIVYVEKIGNETVYSTLIDEKVANTLAHMLLYVATSKHSLNVYARASIYGFSISVTERDLLDELLNVKGNRLKRLILKAILRSPLFVSVQKEIQVSFGKIGKLDPREDSLVIREALRQTVMRYFSIKKTLSFIDKLRKGEIRIVHVEPSTPLGEAVLSHAPIRPWISGIQALLYDVLKGGAYTLSELSEVLSIPPKSLEVKLKQMRRADSKYRVTSFIDVDSRETRWCLIDELKTFASSDEFYTSFAPINGEETLIASLRPLHGSSTSEVIFKPNQILENPEDFTKKIPMDEIGELKIVDPVDPMVCNMSPRYYFVRRDVIPYLLLNASAYIQNMKYT
jgi:ATP-dependent Lhr-like helicase